MCGGRPPVRVPRACFFMTDGKTHKKSLSPFFRGPQKFSACGGRRPAGASLLNFPPAPLAMATARVSPPAPPPRPSAGDKRPGSRHAFSTYAATDVPRILSSFSRAWRWRTSFASSIETTLRPTGQNDSPASLNDCKPNGMVMMKMQLMTPAIR